MTLTGLVTASLLISTIGAVLFAITTQHPTQTESIATKGVLWYANNSVIKADHFNLKMWLRVVISMLEHFI